VPKASLALSNLRALVIIIVVAFHAALAYIASTPSPNLIFNAPPYWWQAFPIVDSHRWLGLDIFCAWQDVSLMSLMFLLSGLFVANSLNRKGSLKYTIDRLWRIGVPFVLGIVVLSPLSFYPAYLVRTADPSLAGFWHDWLALPFMPSGPQWFLWQLLAVNLLAAGVCTVYPRLIDRMAALGAWAGRRPLHFVALLIAASTLAYVPLALEFSPLKWNVIGPFSLQLSRPAHYIVYFTAGFAVGAHGLDRGLLSCDGPLARRWSAWLAAAIASFFVWAGLTSLTFPDWNAAPALARIGASFAFPLACATAGLWLIAIFLRFAGTMRRRAADSLSNHAYSIYLLHYIFVVWLQYLLLDRDLVAPAKMLLVLGVALAMSWAASAAFAWLVAAPQSLALKKRTVLSVPQ